MLCLPEAGLQPVVHAVQENLVLLKGVPKGGLALAQEGV
jgi:hypothetical protein